MSISLVLWGAATVGLSGVPGLFSSAERMSGQRLGAILAVLGCALGTAGVVEYWRSGATASIVAPWRIPEGEFAVELDGLSAFFLVPVFLIPLLGSIYGLEYWKQTERRRNGRKLRLFYGISTAAMALLVVARNGLLFLAAWETMALSAYFLVTTEDDDPEAREAGWIYLVSAHFSTLCLFAMFGLMRATTGSFAMESIGSGAITPGMKGMIFALALVGFGLKAGLAPLHVWLPGAHAIAPSHVSALMSGVILKMGVYGFIRTATLLPSVSVGWGAVVLAAGAISGIVGVVYAIGQHDLKRLLAYHSVENIGIIYMGIGLALIGRSIGRFDCVVLGLGGALLHVWNHAIFKSLLFLSAGSTIRATHTREIDRLGGLLKATPATGACFLAGSAAICGLPPLNGFISELLIYLGLFRISTGERAASFAPAAAGAAALATIGALAAACFVKAFAAVFLGSPRSHEGSHAREAPAAMLIPMIILVCMCFMIGLAPVSVAAPLDRATDRWIGAAVRDRGRLLDFAPLDRVGAAAIALFVVASIVGTLLVYRVKRTASRASTWGCGYVNATPRMQYTASSFASPLVGLFARMYRIRTVRPEVSPVFPRRASFESETSDLVLDGVVLPVFRFTAWVFSFARLTQRGSIQAYLFYILIFLLILLAWR
jgi:hydrogenase-4 component B